MARDATKGGALVCVISESCEYHYSKATVPTVKCDNMGSTLQRDPVTHHGGLKSLQGYTRDTVKERPVARTFTATNAPERIKKGLNVLQRDKPDKPDKKYAASDPKPAS